VTATELLRTCRADGILLAAEGDSLAVDALGGALTPELRRELTARKPDVLAVLVRLDGMRRTVGQVPVPCAVLEAVGGPGRCFSCGDALSHSQSYGRCGPCGIACELFYRECPDAADRFQKAGL